jgi:hypothetical protein
MMLLLIMLMLSLLLERVCVCEIRFCCDFTADAFVTAFAADREEEGEGERESYR